MFCLDLNVDLLLTEILGFFLFVNRCLLLQILSRFLTIDFLFLVYNFRNDVHQAKISLIRLFLIIAGVFTVGSVGVLRLINFCRRFLLFTNSLHDDFDLPGFRSASLKEDVHAMNHLVSCFHQIVVNCLPFLIMLAEDLA